MEWSVSIAYASAGAAGLLAAVWLVFKHRTLSQWSFGVGLGLLAADTALAGWVAGRPSLGEALAGQVWRSWCAALLPGVWLVYSLCYSRGNHVEFLRRWRGMILGAFAVPVLLVAIWEGLKPAVPAAFLTERAAFLPLDGAGKALEVLVMLGLLLALIHLEKTFRSALGLMRWRVKFVVLGLAVIFGGRIYASSQAVLFSGIQLSLVGVLGASLLLGILLVAFSLARAGWKEMDVYPSPAMLYGSLSVLLAGVYLLVVGVLAEAVARWGGDRAFPVKSLVLLLAVVALAVLFLSDRFRQRTQLFISRHLRRPVHDYRQVWTAFTERLTSRMDRADLCRAVVTLIAETFNTLSVTVWIAEPHQPRLQFGASTALSGEGEGAWLDLGPDSAAWMEAVRAAPQPLDLDQSREPWVQALRQGNPDHFHKGGDRLCMPLVAGGEVLGFLLLADRVSGLRFTPEDLDLLKCVGDQVAASLRNLQLSRRLIEAKELEAFQSMSAFFIHDLKNTASTLSMMLQNLPVHFDNPDFRADALRGIAKSVDRLNGLVERLTRLRHGFRLRPVATDLNDLVNAVLGQFASDPRIEMVKSLQPLPLLPVDREQFSQVLTNLLLNARDAVGDGGRIEVTTAWKDGAAVVTVADNGCGMSAAFLSQRLFRPFQTTKKKGLGIGMFQSKMIAEAHGGRMEVESQLGRGTTFRVRLPLEPPIVPETRAGGGGDCLQETGGETSRSSYGKHNETHGTHH